MESGRHRCSSSVDEDHIINILPLPHGQPQSPPISNDDIEPRPGFGWEFSHILEKAWQLDVDRQDGRFERYGRFGMTREEARRPTPEHYRNAYDEFIARESRNLYTPPLSQSPSPSSFELAPPYHRPAIYDELITLPRALSPEISNGPICKMSKPVSYPSLPKCKGTRDILQHSSNMMGRNQNRNSMGISGKFRSHTGNINPGRVQAGRITKGGLISVHSMETRSKRRLNLHTK